MQRAAVERRHTLHVWRRHLSYVHGHEAVLCACELQPGRFRKGQRIAGCARPRCYLCHGDKLLGRPTFQQRRADVSLSEWMRHPWE